MNTKPVHTETREAIVTEALHHKRLDSAMAELFPEFSRSLHKQWILAGHVTVNGSVIKKPRQTVHTDQSIQVQVVLETQTSWQPEPIALNIIYEDDEIIVINKPAGLVTHPGAGNPQHTLVNAILHHCPASDTLPRAGIIHRLDKDTSGLLIAAKTRESLFTLGNAMQAREIHRHYEAIVEGTLIAGNTIDAPIGRHQTQRTKMAIISSGKPAITHYRLIQKFQHHTHVSVQLETGRTHQIRVHFKHIKHPLVGDRTYNPRRHIPGKIPPELQTALHAFPRQALHARRLSLTHPTTGEVMTWEAPLPDDFSRLLESLKTYASNHE